MDAMSWLRTSPLRQSFSRSNNRNNGSNRGGGGSGGGTLDAQSLDLDQKACYDSFCKHWQQVYEIILRAEPSKPSNHDDVVGVVSHLDHLVTLLLVELQHNNKVSLPSLPQTPAPCQEFLLSENLLDKLYEWSKLTGRYSNAVRLEQLKLYELLVSHSRHQVLVHEPFLRPLLKLLSSSQGEIFPTDIEKRLVILLNQLCVVLMQNVHLLDLFFFTSAQQQSSASSPGNSNFIIFSLLIPYVHRDGSLGHQARDALLLCMALSQKNSNVGHYIAKYSSMCTVLVTGLGGLYSLLPNTIEISTSDWHRITSDDVSEITELTAFMNALEFCNAVVQVAHDLIREQLLDVMYMGFIVPVLGPALLQTFKANHLQNNAESQISAMAYLDLILRAVTEPGLLRVFVRFLLDADKFDGQRILDVLVERISSPDTRLCMVTLSLFDTLLSLHCEELLLELALKYLIPGRHVPAGHRLKVNRSDGYAAAVEHFLALTPEVMKQSTTYADIDPTTSVAANSNRKSSSASNSNPMSKTIGANWNHYGLNNATDSLYSNYRAYLFDARQKITQCQSACTRWSSGYRLQSNHNSTNASLSASGGKRSEKTLELIKNFLSEFTPSSHDEADTNEKSKQLDSLQSLGESSGYESFKYRVDDDSSGEDRTLDLPVRTTRTSKQWNGSGVAGCWKTSSRQTDDGEYEFDYADDVFADETISLGPFLTAIWSKLQTFTSNCLYVNLHLTGLISHLTWYPLPLIHSILLRPDIPTSSDTPSFHQLLKILKQQIDAELPVSEDSLELIDSNRFDLIEREFRLVNVRKNAVEGLSKSPAKNGLANYGQTVSSTTNTLNMSAATPPQLTASSYDPFKRGDSKRRSITTSISNIFKRPSSSSSNNQQPSASSGLSQIIEFFKGNSTQHGSPTTSIATTHNMSFSDNQQQPASLELMSSLTSTSSAQSLLGATKDRTRDVAMCAVVLDEWLKELAAIAQEHSIVMLRA